MLIAHPAVGYLVGEAYREKRNLKLTASQKVFWIVWAVFTGIGPDWDFFLAPLLSTPTFLHRHMFTHAPGFWLLLAILGALGLLLLKSKVKKLDTLINPKYAKDLLIVMIMNVFIHLLLDSISGAVPWAWPFSTEVFTITGKLIPYRFDRLPQLTSVLFMVELTVAAISAIKLTSSNRRENSKSGSFHGLLITILIIIVIFTPVTLLSLFTYGPDPSNINFEPDDDKDKIKNTEDSDIDGDGILNVSELYTDNFDELRIATAHTASKITLSLPQQRSTWTTQTLSQLLNIIPDNKTLIANLLMEAGFSIKSDMLHDAITHPARYGLSTPIDSYSYPDIYTVENLYTYFQEYATLPAEIEEGVIVFAKSPNKGSIDVYVVCNYEKQSEQITVLTVSNTNWLLEELVLKKSDLLDY